MLKISKASGAVPAMLLLVVISTAGCGHSTNGEQASAPEFDENQAASYADRGLDSDILSSVLIGTVTERVPDDVTVLFSGVNWFIEVEEVLWRSPQRFNTDGDIMPATPELAPGDKIAATPPSASQAPLPIGGLIVMAAAGLPAPDTYAYDFRVLKAVYHPDTMDQDLRVTNISPDLDELLQPGEGGSDGRLKALTELVDQQAAWLNSRNTGGSDAPGPRLVAAQQIAADRDPTGR